MAGSRTTRITLLLVLPGSTTLGTPRPPSVLVTTPLMVSGISKVVHGAHYFRVTLLRVLYARH